MLLEHADDLEDYVWRRLPMRMRLLGRKRVADVVQVAIFEWPTHPLDVCGSHAQQADIFETLKSQVLSSYKERYGAEDTYGFAIMTIILMALISSVVQVLVKWWLERKLHARQMEEWHCDARGSDGRV